MNVHDFATQKISLLLLLNSKILFIDFLLLLTSNLQHNPELYHFWNHIIYIKLKQTLLNKSQMNLNLLRGSLCVVVYSGVLTLHH